MQRRGAAAVLAMIFLVIFGALSCAFFAVISTSMAVAKNDRDAQHARAAAESGMAYVKHAISFGKISSTVPEDQHIDEVQQTLEAISNNWATSYSGRVITIPELSLQTGEHSFHAEISEVTSVTPRELFVSVTGKDGHSSLTRSVSALFHPRNLGDGVFRWSGASAGGIYIGGGEIIAGRGLMSATTYDHAIQLVSAVLGDSELAVVVSEDQMQQTGSDYDVTVVSPPTISDFTTVQYKPFATTSYSAVKTQSVWQNVHVTVADVGGSKVLKIPGNTTIQGILYVDSGVSIDVTGNPTLNGLVVCELDPTKPTTISMSGNFTVVKDTVGMSAELIELAKGLTILAPTADIKLKGSSGLTTEGSVICNRFIAESSGGGGEAIYIKNGTLLTLYSGEMDPSRPETTAATYISNRDVTFEIDENFELPVAALLYKKQYVMATETYLEQ